MRKRSSAILAVYNMLKELEKEKTKNPNAQTYQRLFEKLCKNHLTGEVREGLKKQLKEQRQGTLIGIGSKSDKGNRLTRFEDINGHLELPHGHKN